jgi:heme-degrading monooxygenase HmoA
MRTTTMRSILPTVHLRALLALSLVTPFACGDDGPDPEPTLDERLAAIADCTPTEPVQLLPWTGPAFDERTGELREPLPAGHVEAVVTGWRDHGEEATQLRIEHAQIVMADVFTRDGLLGFQAVESDECDLSMSHTLWRDEAAMFAFVADTPHATAMGQAAKMHHATAGAHWSAGARTTAPAWKDGIDRMVKEVRAELE